MLFPSRAPANVIAPRNWHYQYLADHLRPDEIEHWLAITEAATYDPDVAARACMNTPGLAFTVMGSDGYPVAAGGFHEIAPGVWKGWMVGTMDGWRKHYRSITRATRWLMGQLIQVGAKRFCVNTLVSRTGATRWYERALGMVHDGTLRQPGKPEQRIGFYSHIVQGEPA
jgi:hypothetical protein